LSGSKKKSDGRFSA